VSLTGGSRFALSKGELQRHAQAWPESAPVALRMIALLEHARDPFSRQNLDPGHFTASAFVLSPDRRRVLLVHHRKLGRWLQPGGHIEATDVDLAAAARREVLEETGIDTLAPPVIVAPLGSVAPPCAIFDVDIHVIPANPKDGAHLHFDVRYAFVAGGDHLDASPEVLGARWVDLDAVAELTDELSVLRCVARLEHIA
jgi:8-oxo-dGTP pyrophosphatase MutT (NUDIX family)